MKTLTIPFDALVTATTDQVSTSTGTDVVILELTNGIYYGLNEVGQTVWEIIKEPIKVSDICEKVASIYDVEPSVCEQDIQTLLGSLLDHKLILIKDSAAL